MDSNLIVALLSNWEKPTNPTVGEMYVCCEPDQWACYSFHSAGWILTGFQKHDGGEFVFVG